MKQIVFRIQKGNIYFYDNHFFELVDGKAEQIQGKDYRSILSRYINNEVAHYFSKLMTKKKRASYKRVVINRYDL
jgi:type III secretory pathway component EscR